MADGNIPQVDLSLVAQIVRSYVAQNNIAVDQVAGLIAMVHRSLSGLGQSAPVPAAVPLEPAVPIRRSVAHDYVVCLECGFRGRTLRRHLRVLHGLELAAYRGRWKLAAYHPLTAPAYSERRSTMAKQSGLGRPREAVMSMPAPEVVAPPPKQRRGKPLDAGVAPAGSEVIAPAAPRRGRKPRSAAAE